MKQEIIPTDVISVCRKKLLTMKSELLNRARVAKMDFDATEKTYSGDEADQTTTQLMENSFLLQQERIRNQLMEIENALARIELGTYGICEETEEKIEIERLLAIPWTRLSIEGAEIRESFHKKFAR